MDFNKGLIQDQAKSVTKAIDATVTGLAETVVSDINRWRDVVANNPSVLPFNLPPTLQSDIDRLKDTLAFTGLNLPSSSEAESLLKKALGDLAKPVSLAATNLIEDGRKSVSSILSQIDWLG
jgi:hypothetical protein